MPYQTFFNLPDVKRQRIMDAVWNEFTTVPYGEASINQIIQNANISRGSFYQYFSGKQDLFAYVLQTILQSAKQMFLAQLTAHRNDLFFAVLGMYDLLVWTTNRNRGSAEKDRIHKLLRLNSHMDMSQFAVQLDCEAISVKMQELMRQCGFQLSSAREGQALLHMLSAVGMSTLADTLRHPQNELANRDLLEHQLLIIRRGLTPCTAEVSTDT